MAEETGIAWCDSTANLWIGCTKVSGACDDCYAEDLMGTEGSRLKKVEWGPKGARLRCAQGWKDLAKWQRAAAKNGGIDPKLGRRRFVFINSLSDFFDNHRTVIWRPEAWALFRECTHLVLILVTKRPQLIRRELPDFWPEIAGRVYIITTTEDQPNANMRVPALLEAFEGIPEPAVMGVSIEPMLGKIDFNALAIGPENLNALTGLRENPFGAVVTRRWGSKLKWVIVGGESGEKTRRPMMPAWVDALQAQCAAAGTAFFFKQWGTWLPREWADNPHPWHERVEPVVTRMEDGAVIDGHHPGGTVFAFQKPRDRIRALSDGRKADALLHGRTYHEFPDERMAA